LSEKILSVKGLKTHFYTYGGVVKALDGVDLDIHENEVVGIVGESGCGKSTLGLSILRLIESPGRIVDGKLLFENGDILKYTDKKLRKARGGKIAMIFQDPKASLNPVLTIGDQIAEAISLHQSTTKKESLKKTNEILREVGIPDTEKRAKEYPFEFSGGMRQRAMIALALSMQPKLLIADEPTTNLDVTTQAQILVLMKELQKKFKTSILLITHDLGVVAQLCEKVIVMYAGKVVESGTVHDILLNPKHPYLQGLLKSMPNPLTKMDRLQIIQGTVPTLINPIPGCRFSDRCEFVMEKCKEKVPEFTKISKDHKVSCYLYEENGGKK